MSFDSKKINTVLLAVIAMLLGSLIWVVASQPDDPTNGMGDHMGHGSVSSQFTGADIMFLQMMIPHHEQAVEMSNLALEVSKNKELLTLATLIARDQSAEIKQMKNWLNQIGASEDPGHSMDGMGGMLTPEEFGNLKSSSGADFDKLWLLGMTQHHEGAIHMVNMIADAQNSDIKNFGENILKVQSDQIEQMKKMLTNIR